MSQNENVYFFEGFFSVDETGILRYFESRTKNEPFSTTTDFRNNFHVIYRLRR